LLFLLTELSTELRFDPTGLPRFFSDDLISSFTFLLFLEAPPLSLGLFLYLPLFLLLLLMLDLRLVAEF
jgi:hypothetical protein